MMTVQEKECPLSKVEPVRVSAPFSMAMRYLVIGRNRDYTGVPWIEFETTDLTAANHRCKEMNEKDGVNSYKIETWTPVPKRNSDSD